MEKFWRFLGVWLGKNWKLVTVLIVLITVLLGFGATRIEFATGQDSYLNPESQTAIDNVKFQGKFGGETVILLFTTSEGSDTNVADLIQGKNLETLTRLNEELSAIPEVASVITPLTSMTFSEALVVGPGRDALTSAATRDETAGDVRIADVTVSLARLGAIPADNQIIGPDNADWANLLVYDNTGYEVVDGVVEAPPQADRRIRKSLASTFPDQQTAVGGVVLQGNASLDEQSAGTEKVLDVLATAEFDGFDLTVTGSPVYLKEINDYLKGGMLTLGLAAFVVMAIVLGLMFRVRWRLLPLLAVLVGVAWSFSLLGLIGIDLSLVTISGLPILIGLGIDFAIQIHNRVEEEVVLDREEHPIAETLANVAPPLIAATITGIVAFLALRISKVPMIRDFGVLLAVGVGTLVIVGIVVPATALGIREFKSPTGERRESLVERIVVKLGGLPTRMGLPLGLAAIALFIGGVLVEGRTKIESDPLKWIDQGSETVADVDFLVERTGFGTTLGILVEANNVYDQDVIDLIQNFTADAEARPEVVSTSSLVNTMSKIIDIDGATPLPPTESDIYGASNVMPPDIGRALVSFDDVDGVSVPTAAQVNLRLASSSLEERAVLVQDLEDDLAARIDALAPDASSILLRDLPADQSPVRAVPAGLATVGIGLLENLSANRAALTYLALSLAGLFLVLRLRSFSRAVLALVPVFMAVGASSLIVGLLGIQLSPLTTVSGPLVIASCAEFCVLILGRYLEERERGLEPRTATNTAASRTGRAFFTSATTTIGGFAVLVLSALPLLRDFGVIVTLNVAIALLAALVVMPPLLVWADERGWLGLGDVRREGSVRLAAPIPGPQTALAAVGVVAFAGAGVAVYASADTSTGVAEITEFAAVATTTTTSTTTTTTTTTTLPPEPGEEPTESTEPTGSTEPAGPAVDPSGYPTDRPEGIAGSLFDLLSAQGVEPNVANCAVEQSYAIADEATLIGMGLLDGAEEALNVLREGSAACGVTTEQVEAAIAAQFP